VARTKRLGIVSCGRHVKKVDKAGEVVADALAAWEKVETSILGLEQRLCELEHAAEEEDCTSPHSKLTSMQAPFRTRRSPRRLRVRVHAVRARPDGGPDGHL